MNNWLISAVLFSINNDVQFHAAVVPAIQKATTPVAIYW